MGFGLPVDPVVNVSRAVASPGTEVIGIVLGAAASIFLLLIMECQNMGISKANQLNHCNDILAQNIYTRTRQ